LIIFPVFSLKKKIIRSSIEYRCITMPMRGQTNWDILVIRFPRNHGTNERTLSYASDVVTRAESRKVSYRLSKATLLWWRLRSSQGFDLANHVRLHTRDWDLSMLFPFVNVCRSVCMKHSKKSTWREKPSC